MSIEDYKRELHKFTIDLLNGTVKPGQEDQLGSLREALTDEEKASLADPDALKFPRKWLRCKLS